MRTPLLLALLVGCAPAADTLAPDAGARPDSGPPPPGDRFACRPGCAGRCVLGVIAGESPRAFCADVAATLDEGEPCAYDVAPLDGPAGFLTSHCAGDFYCRPDPDTGALTCGSGAPCPEGTVLAGDPFGSLPFCARVSGCDPISGAGCADGLTCTPIPVDASTVVGICAAEGSLVEGRPCDLGAGIGCAPGLMCWVRRCVAPCEATVTTECDGRMCVSTGFFVPGVGALGACD